MSELIEPTQLKDLKVGDSLYSCEVTMKVLVDAVTTHTVPSKEEKIIAIEGNTIRTENLQFDLDPEFIDQPGAVLPPPEGQSDENSPMLIAIGTHPEVVEYITHQVVQKVFIDPADKAKLDPSMDPEI
jgi:hypothetical protein